MFTDREVVRAMRNLRPIGIPHSIFLENMFAKTFDPASSKRMKRCVRNFYQEHGYFTARVIDSEVTIRDVGGDKGDSASRCSSRTSPASAPTSSCTVEEGKLVPSEQDQFRRA